MRDCPNLSLSDRRHSNKMAEETPIIVPDSGAGEAGAGAGGTAGAGIAIGQGMSIPFRPRRRPRRILRDNIKGISKSSPVYHYHLLFPSFETKLLMLSVFSLSSQTNYPVCFLPRAVQRRPRSSEKKRQKTTCCGKDFDRS